MGTPLTGQTPSESYIDLLKISNSNTGLNSTLKRVGDGGGTDSIISISTSGVDISGAISLSGTNLIASVDDLNKLNRSVSDGIFQSNKVLTVDSNRGLFTLGGDIDLISNGGGVSNGTISNFGAGPFGYVMNNLGLVSSISINPETGPVFKATITSSSTTVSIATPTFILNDYYAATDRAYWLRLVVVQDGSGSRDLSWPATGQANGNIHFPSGQWTSALDRYPKLTPSGYAPTSGEMDIFDFYSYDHGINWIGQRIASGVLRNG